MLRFSITPLAILAATWSADAIGPQTTVALGWRHIARDDACDGHPRLGHIARVPSGTERELHARVLGYPG